MEDCSPTHAFPNLHLPQPFHIVLPDHHSSEPGYASAQPPLNVPTQDDQTMPCFPNFTDDQHEVCNEGERSLLSTNSLDEEFNVGGHFEGEERHSWYIPKESWEGNTESSTDDYYAKANCYRGHRGTTSYNSCSQLTYNRKANAGYIAKQANAAYFRDNEHNSGHIGLDYSRTSSVTSDLDRDDFGGGLHEEQLQTSEVDSGPWLTGETVWRGEPYSSSVTPQKSLNNRTYTQKLDSFSDAFMSQAKRRLPVITTTDSQNWDGVIRPRLSCSLDSDSSSPSLPSFPSPPTSNLLSPPPTPLPPASHSPSKVDSPGGGGVSVHAGAQQGGEAVGALQFFPVRPQSLLGPNSSGMVWRFPLLSHCFTQLAGEASSSEGNARASLNYNTGPHNVPSLVSSSPLVPVLQTPRGLCSAVHPFFHPASLSSLTSNHQNEENIKQKSSSFLLGTSHDQDLGCPIYTGTTFPSMLQCESRQRRAHFTPQPLLNPLRRGTGLYSSVCHKGRECGEGRHDGAGVLPCINVGSDFQADIPPCLFDDGAEEEWSHDEDESPREHLLWKPWNELTSSSTAREQVEKLLQMCSSSCLPGGGTNTELALHCLHRCHGDVVATLEMLLFTRPRPAGDYHYPGADVWTERETRLFTAALETHGKDFSRIQAMVKTKTLHQCVESYYLRKRLGDKQKTFNLEENGTSEDTEQPKKAPPTRQPITRQIRLEEMVPVPVLAGSFPCKLCGKMFYKIKSRNAHMKIHRQPQEDWTERKLQQQMLNQALNRGLIAQPQTFTENTVTNGNGISLLDPGVQDHSLSLLSFNSPASHVLPSVNSSQEPAGVLQFQPMWSSFGQNSDASSFYCGSEVKAEAGGGAAPVKWK